MPQAAGPRHPIPNWPERSATDSGRGPCAGSYPVDMDGDSLERTRTITWDDPMPPLAAAAQLSGLEYLQSLLAGDYPPPPIAQLLDFTMVEVSAGEVAFECTPGEHHYNPLGLVHGGLACTLLDTVVGCAAHTTLPKGVGYTSIDLQVSYLRPITSASGTLRAIGRVVKGGQRVIFAEGVVQDAEGRSLATATSSLLVLSR